MNKRIPGFIQKDEFENIGGICVSYNEFYDYEPHSHDFYEFDYIAEGEVKCSLNGKEVWLSQGDAVFVSPVDLHSYIAVSGENTKTVTVHFDEENLCGKYHLSDISGCVVHCSARLKETFMLLNEENSNKGAYFAESVRNLLERAVILFLRHLKYEKKAVPGSINYALGYINKNFKSHITLNEISRKCGYSPSYFSHVFKEETGMSFIEYLNGIRLEHAKRIKECYGISVTDLCFECGFGSVRNFSRAYKKRFGVSPSK